MANTGPVLAPSLYQGGTPYNVTPAPIYYGPESGNQNNGGFSLNDIPMNFGGKSGGLADISSKINTFGTKLGFAPGTVTYPSGAGLIGPSLPGAAQVGPFLPSTGAPVAGSLGTSATLSGVAGAAGLGALAGGFLGKIGGNPTGGSIGGGVGAGIGMAVGGPVGAVVGGLIGGIGGGFFGSSKPKTTSSEYTGVLTSSGAWNNLGYSSKSTDTSYGQSSAAEFANYVNMASKSLGIQFKDTVIHGGINTMHNQSTRGYPGFLVIGNRMAEGEKWFDFDPNDQASKQQAMQQGLLELTKRSGLDVNMVKAWTDKPAWSTGAIAQTQKIITAQPGTPTKFQQFLKDYNATIS